VLDPRKYWPLSPEILTRASPEFAVPAIFLDKNTRARSPVLGEVAHENGVQVGALYSDSLDDEAPHYADMMRANARAIQRAMGGL
ncbi:MAG: hypothetical protein ACFNL5_05030, partial [Rothia dentocariosa]